jgi:hypothetical protein
MPSRRELIFLSDWEKVDAVVHPRLQFYGNYAESHHRGGRGTKPGSLRVGDAEIHPWGEALAAVRSGTQRAAEVRLRRLNPR